MVRVLVYIYVLIQIALLLQIHHLKTDHTVYEWLPSIDFLKVAEILVFVPILLILAQRTRQLRSYCLPHIREEEAEADEAAAKKKS